MTMPTVIVEIGFSALDTSAYLHLDDTVRGKLDTATLAGDNTWVDVTAYTLSFTTRAGATRIDGPVLRSEAGTCTIVLDNSDRRFDPTNLSGPYVAGGVTQVEPMRPVRIRATWNGVTYPVWFGYADSWVLSYRGPNFSQVTLTATDAFKRFSRYDRGESASTGAGDDTGTRIGRILDSISWPAEYRSLATGDTTLQATTLAGDALSEMQTAVESELGELYMDAEGNVAFRNRKASVEDARSNTAQAVFGDGGGSELPYSDVQIEYDDTQIFNTIRITRTGGADQTAQSTASQTAYGHSVHERTGLMMQTDAAALDYAGFLLHQGKDPELRFTDLEVNPRRDPSNLWPQVLGRRFGDRITVKLRPPGGGGAAIERDVFIRGVQHEASPDSWRTTFALQSATRWSFLVLDNADLGVLDANALGY